MATNGRQNMHRVYISISVKGTTPFAKKWAMSYLIELLKKETLRHEDMIPNQTNINQAIMLHAFKILEFGIKHGIIHMYVFNILFRF